jgi:hypothetical protein
MSEGITHTAIVDDCARLALHADTICPAFKEVLTDHLEVARLGGITRHGDRHNPGLLETYREQWDSPDRPENVPMKLAFVLGWLSHRAADRKVKRVFRILDPEDTSRPRTCSIYHDVVVLREVYGEGTRDPWGLNVLAEDSEQSQADLLRAEVLLASVWQRTLLRMHTFIPDDADVEPWLDRVIATRQKLYVDMQRYTDAMRSPNPDWMRRFIIEPNFYDRNDPLIRIARALQHDTELPDVSLVEALAADANQSQYARILRKAFSYSQAASEFFARRIGRDELEKRLDIGVPELDEV